MSLFLNGLAWVEWTSQERILVGEAQHRLGIAHYWVFSRVKSLILFVKIPATSCLLNFWLSTSANLIIRFDLSTSRKRYKSFLEHVYTLVHWVVQISHSTTCLLNSQFEGRIIYFFMNILVGRRFTFLIVVVVAHTEGSWNSNRLRSGIQSWLQGVTHVPRFKRIWHRIIVDVLFLVPGWFGRKTHLLLFVTLALLSCVLSRCANLRNCGWSSNGEWNLVVANFRLEMFPIWASIKRFQRRKHFFG